MENSSRTRMGGGAGCEGALVHRREETSDLPGANIRGISKHFKFFI